MLLGLFIDALLIGLWMVASSIFPTMAPRNFPRWAAVIAIVVLAAIPTAAAVLGYLEGRLKLN